MGGSLSLGQSELGEAPGGGQGPGPSSLLSAEAVAELCAPLRRNASLMDARRRPPPSAPALRAPAQSPRLWPSCPSPSFLCGAPLFCQNGAAGAGGRNSTHQGPSHLGWGGGTRGHSKAHGAAVSRPREAACPAVSPLLLHPVSGAGLPRTTSAVGTCSVLPRSAGGRGWLETCGHQGRPGTQHPSLGASLHLCKADLEERLGALWGWAESCWDQLRALLPSQGVCVLHLAKHKLCGVQPHCLVPGAFLTIKGAHLCPKRLGE